MPHRLLSVVLISLFSLASAADDSPKGALLAQDAAAQAGDVQADLGCYEAKGEGQQKLAQAIAQGDIALAKLQAAVTKQFGRELGTAVIHAAGTEDAKDIDGAKQKVEGDQATVTFKDNSPPLHMVKVDGKWKISVADMIGEATDQQIEKLDRAIAEFTAEVKRITDLVEKQKFRSGEGVRDRVQDLHDRLFKPDQNAGQRV
jgi:hypothetical protein